MMRLARRLDHIPRQGYLEGITVPMKVTALTRVIGYAVAGVEFEATGDQHGKDGNLASCKYSPATLAKPDAMLLAIDDHRRDRAGMTYVYPVLSRRAGGISVGINLNPNNACNWRCIYCQVPNLSRGGPPPIDLAQLERELRELLIGIRNGDWTAGFAATECPSLVDVAFSGNGEPTSAREFREAVALARRVVEECRFAKPPRLRLITNGSLVDRRMTQQGIALLGEAKGEVWFKVDVAGPAMRVINGVALTSASVIRRLRRCGELCSTWVQTCAFRLGDEILLQRCLPAYLDILRQSRDRLAGVYLYGLARPSMQPEASRLSRLSDDEIAALAAHIEAESGLTVIVSP